MNVVCRCDGNKYLEKISYEEQRRFDKERPCNLRKMDRESSTSYRLQVDEFKDKHMVVRSDLLNLWFQGVMAIDYIFAVIPICHLKLIMMILEWSNIIFLKFIFQIFMAIDILTDDDVAK